VTFAFVTDGDGISPTAIPTEVTNGIDPAGFAVWVQKTPMVAWVRGNGPSRGRIQPERILRRGSTATDLSPRRLSWHTGCVPAEPINTLSGRTLGV
jgi:hypothetical protein